MKLRMLLFVCAVLFVLPSFLFAALSLEKGVTIGDWLDEGESYWIQTTLYSKADFMDIQSIGCDHVRIEINLNAAMENEVPAIILDMLDQSVMWAKELGLKIVIVNSEDGLTAASVDVTQARLTAQWASLATHFAAHTDVVAFELYANPGDDITAEVFNGFNSALLAAVRGVSTDLTVIIGSTFLYDVDLMDQVQPVDDSNVIYAFDMFDPLLFTYQSSEFNDVDYLTEPVPFPYDAGSMPEMSAETAGTEAETAYNNYVTEGTVDAVKAQIDKAAAFATTNGVSVYCAGFGLNRIADMTSRQTWIETVRTHLETNNIGWCYSSIRGGFGIMDETGSDIFKYDANDETIAALGLTVPEDAPYETKVLEEGFVIFDEEISEHCHVGWWLGDGEPNFMWTDYPAVGNVCMAMWYPGQYNAIDFFFVPYLDLLALAEADFVLDMFFRCDDPEGHFQARFEDTDEGEDDHPWRMNYHVDDSVAPFDGEWQRITIPLAEMDDQGAWDAEEGQWYNGGQGLYEWDYCQRFQIVSETAPQLDTELYFDRIRVVSSSAVEERTVKPKLFNLEQNYPNPFNPTTTIEYSVPEKMQVSIAVYNIRGELVQNLISADHAPGMHHITWNGLDAGGSQAASGVYFYRLEAEDFEMSKSMLLMR